MPAEISAPHHHAHMGSRASIFQTLPSISPSKSSLPFATVECRCASLRQGRKAYTHLPGGSVVARRVPLCFLAGAAQVIYIIPSASYLLSRSLLSIRVCTTFCVNARFPWTFLFSWPKKFTLCFALHIPAILHAPRARYGPRRCPDSTRVHRPTPATVLPATAFAAATEAPGPAGGGPGMRGQGAGEE